MATIGWPWAAAGRNGSGGATRTSASVVSSSGAVPPRRRDPARRRRRRPEVARGEQVPVQPPGRRFGLGGVLLGQRLAEPVERRQGLVPAAARGQCRHQRPVRALIERVGGGHGADDVDHLHVLAQAGQHLGVLHQQPEMAFAEGLTWPLGPFLEPVFWQQVASVQRGDRPVTRRVPGPPGPQAGGVEGVRVEPRHGAL
jgi:hypothetical protein